MILQRHRFLKGSLGHKCRFLHHLLQKLLHKSIPLLEGVFGYWQILDSANQRTTIKYRMNNNYCTDLVWVWVLLIILLTMGVKTLMYKQSSDPKANSSSILWDSCKHGDLSLVVSRTPSQSFAGLGGYIKNMRLYKTKPTGCPIFDVFVGYFCYY